MSRTLNVTAGSGVCPPGAITRLALATADIARAKGLKFEAIKCSHVPGSPSRHVYLRDRAGRQWFLRISNHYRPRRAAKCNTPHFDLVSFDGVSGRGSLEFFLGEIAAGRADWFDPNESYRPRPGKARR